MPDDFALKLPGAIGEGVPGNPLAYNPMIAFDGATLDQFKANGARNLNGSSQTFSLADHPDIRCDSDLWISCRFRVDSLTIAGMTVLAKGTEYRLAQISATQMRFQAEDAAGGDLFTLDMELESAAPYDDKWLIFTGLIDVANRRATAYIEEQRYSMPFNGANLPRVGSDPMTLGSRNNSLWFDGRISSVLIGKPPTALEDLQDEIRLATENWGNPLDCRQLTADQLTRWGCVDTVWPMDGPTTSDEPSTSGVHTFSQVGNPDADSGPPNAFILGYKQA